MKETQQRNRKKQSKTKRTGKSAAHLAQRALIGVGVAARLTKVGNFQALLSIHQKVECFDVAMEQRRCAVMKHRQTTTGFERELDAARVRELRLRILVQVLVERAVRTKLRREKSNC